MDQWNRFQVQGFRSGRLEIWISSTRTLKRLIQFGFFCFVFFAVIFNFGSSYSDLLIWIILIWNHIFANWNFQLKMAGGEKLFERPQIKNQEIKSKSTMLMNILRLAHPGYFVTQQKKKQKRITSRLVGPVCCILLPWLSMRDAKSITWLLPNTTASSQALYLD